MKPDYSAAELAQLFGVHIDTVRRLARAGRLSGAYKIGQQWRFVRETVADLRGQIVRSTYHRDIDLSTLEGEHPE